MASRLQLHAPTPNAVLPKPLVEENTEQEQEALLLQPPTVLLANHQIEAELLGRVPRWVRRTEHIYFVFATLLLFFSQTPLMIAVMTKNWSVEFLYLPSVFLVAYIVSLFFLFRSQTRVRNALRYWRAQPAVIEEVGDAIRFTSGDVSLVCWYQNSAGEFVRRNLRVSAWAFRTMKLAAEDTFTLLVSPEDDSKVLPYFDADGFRVMPIEPTTVSHNVSARIAAQATGIPRQAVGSLGAIEPELLGTTPRPTRITRARQRALEIAVAVFVAVATVFILAPQLGIQLSWLVQSQFLFQLAVQCLVFTSVGRAHKAERLLKNGIPIRALITAENDLPENESTPLPNRVIVFSYEFECDGVVQHGSFTMHRKQAWRLRIAEGSTFTVLCDFGTVLCDLRKPAAHLPYFQITDYGIRGAMGARITPP